LELSESIFGLIGKFDDVIIDMSIIDMSIFM
jgi:hypothetical protein